ncbi:MAG: type II toxin-antitoxin system HicA family toxin [Candidatus Zambryskibacteria bacterium]|nr:type II toxin-antitoxin system HicA family toxin [Candidatus Zambryskibacteria bacterium]
MPKLYSSKRIIKVLGKNGFVVISQKGSHLKLFSKSGRLVVIVPANKKEIPVGTFYSILRQSKLSKEDFK